MSRALRSGAPRLLGNHGGAAGKWFDTHYRALLARLGPFDAMTRDYAGAAAALWVQFREATAAVKAAQEARANGKGRRPSTAAVERLRRRQGLSWQSYDQAVKRLEELSARRAAPADALANVRRAVEEANRR